MVDFEFREHYSIDDLRQIVALLRHPGGCPWDREQTHESLRRCLTEECCEVLEAIDRKDDALLCEELGDVLLQVVFHASLAEDGGRFTLDDVADGVCKKMIFRHPHVFGTVHAETTGEVLANWDALKREEKGIESDTDVLRAVARTLPALWRAEKVLSKAAKAGFPWPDAAGALDALDEQTQALRHAAGTETEMRAALGDALFAAAAAARWAGADPEELLHEATDRYISRFSRAEQTAKDQGRPLAGLGREEQLQAWNHAKEQKNQQDVQEDKNNE